MQEQDNEFQQVSALLPCEHRLLFDGHQMSTCDSASGLVSDAEPYTIPSLAPEADAAHVSRGPDPLSPSSRLSDFAASQTFCGLEPQALQQDAEAAEQRRQELKAQQEAADARRRNANR